MKTIEIYDEDYNRLQERLDENNRLILPRNFPKDFKFVIADLINLLIEKNGGKRNRNTIT